MQKEGFVTGVIKDFNFKSLSEEIEPLFLYVNESNPKFIAVKLNAHQHFRFCRVYSEALEQNGSGYSFPVEALRYE